MAQEVGDQGGASDAGVDGRARPVRGLPGDPTAVEVEVAREWLAKRGVRVGVPTRLLAIRIGARRTRTLGAYGWMFASIGLGSVSAVAYQSLQYLLGVRGVEMTESSVIYFLVMSLQLGAWIPIRRRERQIPSVARPDNPSGLKLLDGWYVTAAVITFVGGAVLSAAMYFTTPARTYASSWLGLLGLGAICFTVVLTLILRAPARAEDEASLAVDTILRGEDIYQVMPAAFAVPVLFDLITTNRQPHQFTVWLAVYAALAVSTQLAGWMAYRRRHRALPSGYYGTPAPLPTEPSECDWTPPQERA